MTIREKRDGSQQGFASFLAAQSAPLAGACEERTLSPRSGAASRIFSVHREAVFLHLTGALVQREEGAESESGLRKSADGKSDRLPLGGLAVRVVVPASECRGGGVAARPAKVSPQKDQEKRAFSASSEVASPVTLDGLPASGDWSCESAAWQQSFVFQVSDREPALRVTYPPPFNVVAALAASPASENAGRSVWCLYCTKLEPISKTNNVARAERVVALT